MKLRVNSSPRVKRVRYSPSRELRAVVRNVPKVGQSQTASFLEIWSRSSNRPTSVHDFSERKRHGHIYEDDRMGSMVFSEDEERLFYIAEKRREPGIPYFSDVPTDDVASEQRGSASVFIQNWGEQMREKCQSVLVVVNLSTDAVQVIPEAVFGGEGFCPAEFVVTRDQREIAGVVYDSKPFKLGASACYNRKTRFYILRLDFSPDKSLDLDRLAVEWVDELDGMAVWNLRLNPDGKDVVFLANTSGGAHRKTAAMYVVNVEVKRVEAIIPVTRSMDPKIRFAGIYGSSPMPTNCFVRGGADSKAVLVVFTSPYVHHSHGYSVDLNGGSGTCQVRRLTGNPETSPEEGGEGSWNLLESDFESGLLLASWSDGLNPVKLMAAYYRPGSGTLDWKVMFELTRSRPPFLENSSVLRLRDIKNGLREDLAVPGPNAVLLTPGGARTKSVPLVCVPHGGPHSVFLDEYVLTPAVLVALGFAVLRVNYRGSLGCGEDFLNALPGDIGSLDVSDCISAVMAALEACDALDPSRMALYGASHGGFLVAHLSSKYPDMFKCAVVLNPPVDIPAKISATDVPDLGYFGCGFEYSPEVGPLTEEQFGRMKAKSPIAYVDSINCPFLIHVGSQDLRVSPSQGFLLYYALKARGVTVQLRRYDDGHSLSKANVAPSVTVSSILWIIVHTQPSQ